MSYIKNIDNLKIHTSRRNFFRKISFIIMALGIIFGKGNNTIEAQTTIKNDSIKPYINFLESNNFLSAKEYIISKFETNDIVIFSERYHGDMSQYDVIMDVVKDERFKGHIYTEIGSENLAERFNRFLLNSTFTEVEKESELRKLYRDICPSIVWEPYNYYHMLSEVWEINKNRKEEDKILIFPTDPWLDYNVIQTHREWAVHWYFIYGSRSRDVIMGSNFVDYYEKVKKEKSKALVILNTMHGFKQYPTYLPLPTRPLIRRAGEFICKTYPDKTFVVYMNCANVDVFDQLSNNGIIDAAFEYTGKDNIGFDLKNTPIGNSKFDLFEFGEGYDTNINYDHIYDGMVFYKPLKEMIIKMGAPNLYPKEDEELFFKRVALINNMSLEDAKKNQDYIEYLKKINTPTDKPIDEYLGEGTLDKWEKQIKKWIE